MLYPYIEDYKDSFRNPDNYFDKLKPLFPVNAPWDDTMPYFITGGFAVVFKIKDANGKYWAFKCFTQEVADRKERLKNIAEHLQHLKSPYFVDFRYFENELWVCSKYAGDKEYPVVMMEWIEGVTLGKYINQLCQENNTSKLYEVLQKCVKMFAFLLDSGVAHGDLKHDNILVKPNGDVVLVDYDGMYVPTLWHKEMVELGSPSYQHPNRQNNGFNAHLDHFSMLVMLTSLYTLYVNPSLKPNQNTDTLFFQKEDFLQPRQSPRFQAIASLQNPLLNALTTEIKKVLMLPLFLHIPKLREFLGEIIHGVFEEKVLLKKQNFFLKENTMMESQKNIFTMKWWKELSNEWQRIFEKKLSMKVTEVITTIKLNELKNLTLLGLIGNKIMDIYPIQHLINLTSLNLYHNQIIDIYPLQHLTNLVDLRLGDNKITDISPLQRLTNLTSLYLGNNEITSISALQHLKYLTILYLGNNKIIDTSTLQGLTVLTILYLESNKITDISALQHLTNLTTLNLSNNQITDISPLKYLKNLIYLTLRYNKISQEQQDMLRKALPNCVIEF